MLTICAVEYRGKSLAGFIRYVSARLFSEYETRAYRTYVTDALFVAANNTARFAGGNTLSKRFADLVYADNQAGGNIDTDAESIIAGVLERAGLELI